MIVLVYNNRRRIGFSPAAPLDRMYPRDRYAVIVVDNGSPDGILEVAAQAVTFLVERRRQGSRAVRDRALEEVTGEMMARESAVKVPGCG